MPAVSTQITLAMLQFVQPAPHPTSVARWTLWPGGRRLWRPDLCAALEAMPRPVLVSAHVEPGGLTAVPLADVVPEARAWLEHEWRNQGAYLGDRLTAPAPDAGDASVLLELEADALVASAADLAAWAREYVVTSCGWTLADSGGDARAPLRMLLRRPDGRWSPGASCGRRGPAA